MGIAAAVRRPFMHLHVTRDLKMRQQQNEIRLLDALEMAIGLVAIVVLGMGIGIILLSF